MYTPNLGLGIAFFDREREQGRFKGSTKRVKVRSKGARGSIEGAQGSTGRARGTQQERKGSGSSREPDLAAPYPATAASVIYLTVLPGAACCCLDSYKFDDS